MTTDHVATSDAAAPRTTMRAVPLRRHGGAEVLVVEEVAAPSAGPGQILVEVHHTAINRADVLQRLGFYPDPSRPELEIPGMEYAGVVAALGDGVHEWRIGDEVMGIETGGCYAERLVTPARQAMAVPAGVALADAAAIPEVFITAWDALVVQGGLTSGRWALVHAGASGVGTAAIQIAKAFGARVAVTCSAPKRQACTELGADVVLERSPADWQAELEQAVPGGIDTVVDLVGGDELVRNLAVAKVGATIVQVGLLGGTQTTVDVATLLRKRLTWIGTTLRARPLEQKIAISRRFADEVVPRFADGSLRPVIDRRFPLDAIADAHRLVESNQTIGKVLIDLH